MEPEVTVPATADAAPPARRPVRMFGIKDIFTTINCMGGVIAICLCIDGHPFWAGVSMLLGYLLGDTLDGYIARKLGTSNTFGAEYDTISDHLAHCIAPGAIVYTVYRGVDLGLPHWAVQPLAILLGGSIMVTASIRHARNIAQPIEVQGVWAGLPRTVLGFVSVAYVNARLAPYIWGGYWVGVFFIPFACFLALTHLPFPSHRMKRGHFGYVKVAITCFFTTTIGIMIVNPGFIFDLLLFWMCGYAMAGWRSMTGDELRAYRAQVKAALAAPPR